MKNKLERRIKYLRQLIAKKELALQKAPEGTIEFNKSRDKVHWYQNLDGKRRYIKNHEIQLVQKLCQKDYDQKVLKAARKELKQLEKIWKIYSNMGEEGCCERISGKIAPERSQYIDPICLSDEEYIKKWEATEYAAKGFREDAPDFYTEKGERVRSKTEILIANALKRKGIPYRYECLLKLDSGEVIYPDFTVLNVRKRKEMYFEHLGMMDDEKYRENALRRILLYEKNGIFPGDKLVLTHETDKSPVDSRLIEKIIDQYFK